MNKTFRTFWETFNKTDDKLTQQQLGSVRNKIETWDKKHVKYSDKVKRLQRTTPKLQDEWKAERVIRTEDSRNEADSVKSDAEELGFTRFKCILSPNACKTCRAKTDNGNKIFTTDDLAKTYSKTGVPWHPNCSCIIIPTD
jgi:hypothetical protein